MGRRSLLPLGHQSPNPILNYFKVAEKLAIIPAVDECIKKDHIVVKKPIALHDPAIGLFEVVTVASVALFI